MKVTVGCQTDCDEKEFFRLERIRKNPLAYDLLDVATKEPEATEESASSTECKKPAEGLLRCMIKNFTSMVDPVRGPYKTIGSVAWRIMVMPRNHLMKKGKEKCLGFFLQCCPDAYSDLWSCTANAELRLICQNPNSANFCRKTTHDYTAKENDWGYSCFIAWAEILDESNGYMKDGNVILEVFVKSDPAKNVLTFIQFEKKIQDYIRLADVQSSRGFIDKAIEVNLSAITFCEDRNANYKALLEAQKAKLIELKLKESIERIEKAPTDDESLLNPSSLKQVLAYSAANKPSTPCRCSKGAAAAKAKEIAAVEKDTNTTKSPNARALSKEGAVSSNKRAVATSDRAKERKEDELPTKKTLPAEAANANRVRFGSTNGISNARSNNGTPKRKAPLRSSKRPTKGRSSKSTVNSSHDPKRNGEGEASGSTAKCQPSREVLDASNVPLPDDDDCIGSISDDSDVGADETVFTSNEDDFEVVGKEEEAGVPSTGCSPTSSSSNVCCQTEVSLLSEVNEPTNVSETSEVSPNSVASSKPAPLKRRPVAKKAIANTYIKYSALDQDERVRGAELKAIARRPKGATTDHHDLTSSKDGNLANVREIGLKSIELISMLTTKWDKSVASGALSKLSVLAQAMDAKNAGRKWSEGLKDTSTKLYDTSGKLIKELKEILLEYHSDDERDDDELDRFLAITAKRFERFQRFFQLVIFQQTHVDEFVEQRLSECIDLLTKHITNLEKANKELSKKLIDEQERCSRSDDKSEEVRQEMTAKLKIEKENHEKTSQVLKQKKNEMKQMEKTVKQQERALKQNEKLAESAREAQQKAERLTKELRETKAKLNDEVRRLRAELNVSNEARKSALEELGAKESECAQLRTQLSERTHSLKRNENAVSAERRTLQNNLTAATDRAKKAELLCLEQRLNVGLLPLERSLKEATQRVREMEAMRRKLPTNMSCMAELNRSLDEWKGMRETITSMITAAKNDFLAQMDQVKGGKLMSQLPHITVPPPPVPPKAFKLPHISSTPSFGGDGLSLNVPPKSVGVIGQSRRITTRPVNGSAAESNGRAVGNQSPLMVPAPPSPPSRHESTAQLGSSVESAANLTTSGDASQQLDNIILPPPTWNFNWEGPPVMLNPISELLTSDRPPCSSESSSTETIAPSSTPALNGTPQFFETPPESFPVFREVPMKTHSAWELPPAREFIAPFPPPPVPVSNGSIPSTMRILPLPSMAVPRYTGYQPIQWDNGCSTFFFRQPPPNDPFTDINKNFENHRGFAPQCDMLLEFVRDHFPNIPRATVQEFVNSFMLSKNCPDVRLIDPSEFLQYVVDNISVKEMWNGSVSTTAVPQPKVMMSWPMGNSVQGPLLRHSTSFHSQMRDGIGK